MSNFREEYPMKTLKVDELDSDFLVQNIKKNQKIAKGISMSMGVFGITLAFVMINTLINREQSEAIMKTGLGASIGLIMALSLICYAAFLIMAKKIPDKNWRCPHCQCGFPYIVPIGKKASVNHKLAQKTIEEQRLAIGRVDGAYLVIPEKCPQCGKRIQHIR